MDLCGPHSNFIYLFVALNSQDEEEITEPFGMQKTLCKCGLFWELL